MGLRTFNVNGLSILLALLTATNVRGAFLLSDFEHLLSHMESLKKSVANIFKNGNHKISQSKMLELYLDYEFFSKVTKEGKNLRHAIEISGEPIFYRDHPLYQSVLKSIEEMERTSAFSQFLEGAKREAFKKAYSEFLTKDLDEVHPEVIRVRAHLEPRKFCKLLIPDQVSNKLRMVQSPDDGKEEKRGYFPSKRAGVQQLREGEATDF